MTTAGCELCAEAGGRTLCDDGRLRVVAVDEPDYPGFMRVVWNAHVREFTDLAQDEQAHLVRVLAAVEQAQRAILRPHKMNLASLGNQTPHLHWHLIPRFADDAHFPRPIWAERQREADVAGLAERRALLPALEAAIVAACPAQR